MKTNITLLVLITIAFTSCTKYYIKKGDVYYKTMQYSKAISSYNKAGNQPSEDLMIRLADSYRLNNDYKNAEKWYAEIVSVSKVPGIYTFYYAKALMNNEKYVDAKKWFQKYLEIKPNDRVTQTLIVSCDSSAGFFSQPDKYVIRLIDIPEVTSAFSPAHYQGGIAFAADKSSFSSSQKQSGWTGRSYLDLYTSQKSEDGSWSDPSPLKGDVNGKFHEGPAVFNPKGNVMFFTRSNYSGNRKLGKDEQNESNLKIYSAELKEGLWTNLKELPFNSNKYSCGHPALAPDGKTLYFISDMPGGKGGTDLYKVTLSEDMSGIKSWSAPENLGDVINTEGDEMFPYMHSDGVLYFSSDAHNTLGGLDIFSSFYNGKEWSEPENLKYPVNSPKDDFGFILNDDNKTGYISSNRSDTDRIYEVKLADLIFIVKGKVTVKGSGEALPDALVEVRNNKDDYIQSLPVDDNGNYWMKLKAGVDYEIQALNDGYLKPEVLTIKTSGKKKSEVFRADFQLEKIQTEKPIVIENIYYDLDRWNIRSDAAKELDRFVLLLKNNPEISVVLNSHTDARAADNYNLSLSEKRAKSAVDYLIKQGIDPKRLQWKGCGETVLVNKCGNGVDCPEELHQQNRRTEFRIIKIEQMAQK